jgi:AcrR family transcriptional regulator
MNGSLPGIPSSLVTALTLTWHPSASAAFRRTWLRATLHLMSESDEFGVPADLVAAAIRAAEQRGEDVADVPLIALAEVAGVSRSTLLRRIGGSRRALDDAVRVAGVDPGGRRPVRERAVEAAAGLISERGLAGFTLEAVADAAGCSVHSLYAAFGGRDELLGAVYERYSPLRDLEGLIAEPRAGLEETVHGIYRALAASLSREPRVMPAMLADLFSRADGPTGRIFQMYFPRTMDSVGGWLAAEVREGRIRALPVPLLIQQMVGPLAVHLLFRPAMVRMAGPDLPSVEDTCAVFAEAFLRAVAVPMAKAPSSVRSAAPQRLQERESES